MRRENNDLIPSVTEKKFKCEIRGIFFLLLLVHLLKPLSFVSICTYVDVMPDRVAEWSRALFLLRAQKLSSNCCRFNQCEKKQTHAKKIILKTQWDVCKQDGAIQFAVSMKMSAWFDSGCKFVFH